MLLLSVPFTRLIIGDKRSLLRLEMWDWLRWRLMSSLALLQKIHSYASFLPSTRLVLRQNPIILHNTLCQRKNTSIIIRKCDESSWELSAGILTNCVLFKSIFCHFTLHYLENECWCREFIWICSLQRGFFGLSFCCGVTRLYDSKMSNSIDSKLSSLKELMSMYRENTM